MRYFLRIAAAAAALAMAGCGEKPVTLDEYNTQIVTAPDGSKIRAEVMVHAQDMMRGMMFRDSLAPDRGMLFVHGGAGKYKYWMYQVRIPLDIIWMDESHRVLEISSETPPCRTKASGCPSYGGNYDAIFVLELAGGMAKKYGISQGSVLKF